MVFLVENKDTVWNGDYHSSTGTVTDESLRNNEENVNGEIVFWGIKN